ncbi:MAG: hypothetical protein WKG01_20070 [Kofleriaceae bacterium]
MRTPVVAALLGFLFVGCESKQAAPAKQQPVVTETTRAPLVDLTSATSLNAVRTAFNVHKGEARFLTLLSPT